MYHFDRTSILSVCHSLLSYMARIATYRVQLSPAERELLLGKSRSRKENKTVKTRIRVLLSLDENQPHPLTREQCSKKHKISKTSICNILKQYCTEGLDSVLTIKRNPNSNLGRQIFHGEDQARVIAKACSQAPEGRACWTLRFLADEVSVILERSISKSTVHRILQGNELKPHLTEYWCIPPERDAEYVAAMEDVLDIYQRPYDPQYPVWCLDEKPYQLLGEPKEPLVVKPGSVRKVDAEYVRKGHAAIFCFIEPLTGVIHQSVQESRTCQDFARQLKWLVDVGAPDANKITVIMDNLNTHKISSLYKTFSSEEASRIREKIEIHYTPKHGSWLNIAEVGISIMARECLKQRISSLEELRSKLSKWEVDRGERNLKINWQFTKEKARIKLAKLYPVIEESTRKTS